MFVNTLLYFVNKYPFYFINFCFSLLLVSHTFSSYWSTFFSAGLLKLTLLFLFENVFTPYSWIYSKLAIIFFWPFIVLSFGFVGTSSVGFIVLVFYLEIFNLYSWIDWFVIFLFHTFLYRVRYQGYTSFIKWVREVLVFCVCVYYE